MVSRTMASLRERVAFCFQPALFFPLFLCGFSFFNMLAWPIFAGDTDIWYHLNGGRYLFEHGHPPRESFFSFLEPPRPFVDYYWGFQALVYGLYSLGGYHALVVLRALLFLGILSLILLFLFRNESGRQSLLTWPALLFYVACPLLILRCFLLRPHCTTYLFIILFLYLLEFAPRRAWWLPPLAVLWCNFHGVVYPILFLIAGAYLVDLAVRRMTRRAPAGGEERRLAWPLALSLAAVLLTPHGTRLLGVARTPTAHASDYIRELVPVSLTDLLSFHLDLLTPSQSTLFNVLFYAACAALIASVRRRTFRLAHLLLFVGGAGLLTKGNRFAIECALLSLPLLKAHPLYTSSIPPAPFRSRWTYLPLASAAMFLPLHFLVSAFDNPPARPMSRRNLPAGIVAFLNHVNTGGRVVNHSNTGGYLQWGLGDRYRIFMDMQVPFLFTDADIYLQSRILSDAGALRAFLSTYDPDYLIVPQQTEDFPPLIAQFPDFRLVFFDDMEVLYANRQRLPELVARYEVTEFDPYVLPKKDIDVILRTHPDRLAFIRRARQMLAIDRESLFLNYAVATTLNEEGAHDRALPFAEAIIASHPDSSNGYRAKGDALQGLGRLREAVATYKTGLIRAGSKRRPALLRQLGLAYLAQHRYAEAYDALRQGVEIFFYETTREHLAALRTAAALAGKSAEIQFLSSVALEPGNVPLSAGSDTPSRR
jgi:hypothetical protein